MRRDLDQKLVEDFPVLYKDRYASIQKSCMPWGFSCGDGWEPIIRSLSEQLTKISKLSKHTVIASQVKEKFGTLNFYYYVIPPVRSRLLERLYYALKKRFPQWNWIYHLDVWCYRPNDRVVSEIISSCVSHAEDRSAVTCEVCGEWGKLRGGGWLVTQCDKHYAEYCEKRGIVEVLGDPEDMP